MGRVMAVDYGKKRCGIAVTDILQISANGLPTVESGKVLEFIKGYCDRESVDLIVVGYPRTLSGEDSESMKYIKPFLGRLAKMLPEVRVEMFDERFTSAIAHQEMLAGGFSRKQRREKGRADEMAAVLILTDWLNARH